MAIPQQLAQKPGEERKTSSPRTVTTDTGETKVIEEVKREGKTAEKGQEKQDMDDVISDDEEEKAPRKEDPPSPFAELAKFKKSKMQGAHKQEVTSVHFQVEKNADGRAPIMFVTTSLDGFIKMHSTGD